MKKEITFCWSITSLCNLQCSYCFSKYENKTYKHMSEHLINVTLKKLEEKSKDTSIRLIILGGEPTLYPYLKEVCQKALSFCRKVIVVTNGTKKEVLNCLPQEISLDVSYHGQKLKYFLSTVNELRNYHYVQVLCPIDERCLSSCFELSTWCQKENIYFEAIPLVDNETEVAHSYTKEILDKFPRNILYYLPREIPMDNLSLYEKYKTYCEKDRFIICEQPNIALYQDGFLYPCCGTGLRKYKKHIEDENIFHDKLVCQKQYCRYNRGCLDFAGWRQDPDGFFYRNNQ